MRDISKTKMENIAEIDIEKMANRIGCISALDTLEIDIPIVDFAFMRKVIINGKEKDIGRLTKWSLILEVNHLPRIERICERSIEKEFLPRETYNERTR